jgi:hypothetical protein
MQIPSDMQINRQSAGSKDEQSAVRAVRNRETGRLWHRKEDQKINQLFNRTNSELFSTIL